MGVVLLSFLKAHIWLLSYWHFFLKKPRYGCCPVDIFKSPDMVVVMLAFFFFLNSRHGCRPVDTFKIKSPNMVVVLLEFLSNMTHVLLASSSFIKMC